MKNDIHLHIVLQYIAFEHVMQAVRENYREQPSSNEPHDRGGGGHGGHTSRSLMQALGSPPEMTVALPRDVRKTCT